MRDTLIYREFVATGGAACTDYLMAMGRALHDNGIGQALAQAVPGERIVAIMGGHVGARGDDVYADTARLASRIAAAGFTLASGGGPGIMEATHLGAAFAGDVGLEDALKEISAKGVPTAIPDDAGKLVKGGTIDPDIAEALGDYLAPAVRIMRSLGRTGGIGIPTWLYGHEPTTPFAGPIAKYFQNSIREDGLLALATNGIIYMKGGAGTLQEVFQDAAQNYYKTFPTGPGKTGEFSPMVFYGDFWTKTLKVRPVLKALFGKPAKAPDRNIGNDYADWVRFLSDPDEVIAHLESFGAKPGPGLDLMKAHVSFPSADLLDDMVSSTVLVPTASWNSGSPYVTAYADGSCYNPNQMWNVARASLSQPTNAGNVPACDNSGSMSAMRCVAQ
jgi:predicted Rossmann-fold nucleotide-binding protein